MKFLLAITMLTGSVFANAAASEPWQVKCFEKNHRNLDLAYIISVDREPVETFNRHLELIDCTRDHDDAKSNCRERGDLRKVERQNESCLVLERHGTRPDGFSLCYQEQETLNDPHRLVPVTVTDDRQESRIYCEKELLRIL